MTIADHRAAAVPAISDPPATPQRQRIDTSRRALNRRDKRPQTAFDQASVPARG